MKAVILAAGASSRLRSRTTDRPKCLVDVRGKPILQHQLEALAFAGVEEATVVVGYHQEKVRDFISTFDPEVRTRLVINRHYATTDNARSLQLALDEWEGTAIILDGDILFDATLLYPLIARRNCLVVDEGAVPTPEDCKVEVEDGYAVGIGKRVRGFVYTSMASLDGLILDELRAKLNTYHGWYSGPLDAVLREYPRAVSVAYTGIWWRCEIDTEEDLMEARRICEKMW